MCGVIGECIMPVLKHGPRSLLRAHVVSHTVQKVVWARPSVARGENGGRALRTVKANDGGTRDHQGRQA